MAIEQEKFHTSNNLDLTRDLPTKNQPIKGVQR